VTNESDEDPKPNSNSETGAPCACRHLQQAADEPANPVVFDAKMNEYHLTHLDLAGTGRHGHSIIRYCYWCGGAAPRSKHGTFVAHITDAESRRLQELGAGVKTVEEAVAKFGPPDEDHAEGLRTKSPASDTEPSVVRSYRLLRYTGLSETANVTFTDSGPDGALRMSLESKYVGEPKAKP
jgi:hypothetical protein